MVFWFRLSWKYEGNELKVNCRRFGRASNPQAVYTSAPPSAINIEQINFVPNPFLKPIQRLSPIKVCPGKRVFWVIGSVFFF